MISNLVENYEEINKPLEKYLVEEDEEEKKK